MYISINNIPVRVKQSIVQQVVRCHKEGWQPVNIASICGVKAEIVKKILEEKNLL